MKAAPAVVIINSVINEIRQCLLRECTIARGFNDESDNSNDYAHGSNNNYNKSLIVPLQTLE